MANFPLVLAIEPRLLPYARANGFAMDHKVRLIQYGGAKSDVCL